MDITVKGTIVQVLALSSGTSQSGKAWQKQEYLLEHEHGQYAKTLVFTVFGEERINQFALKQGEEVTIHLNIDSREYQGKRYNDIQAWKVEREPSGTQQMSPGAQMDALYGQTPAPAPMPTQAPPQDDSQLPF